VDPEITLEEFSRRLRPVQYSVVLTFHPAAAGWEEQAQQRLFIRRLIIVFIVYMYKM